MRLAAIAISMAALALYGALMFRDPTYALLAPRGGVFSLSVGLLFALTLIWLSRQEHRALKERLQFAVAGWIWLLVQAGGILYELHMSSPPVA